MMHDWTELVRTARLHAIIDAHGLNKDDTKRALVNGNDGPLDAGDDRHRSYRSRAAREASRLWAWRIVALAWLDMYGIDLGIVANTPVDHARACYRIGQTVDQAGRKLYPQAGALAPYGWVTDEPGVRISWPTNKPPTIGARTRAFAIMPASHRGASWWPTDDTEREKARLRNIDNERRDAVLQLALNAYTDWVGITGDRPAPLLGIVNMPRSADEPRFAHHRNLPKKDDAAAWVRFHQRHTVGEWNYDPLTLLNATNGASTH